jgi:hypothetical protein
MDSDFVPDHEAEKKKIYKWRGMIRVKDLRKVKYSNTCVKLKLG